MAMEPEELDEAIKEIVVEKYSKERQATPSPWAFSAQTLPGYVALITFLLGLIYAYSDFKVSLNDVSNRLATQSERMALLDKRLYEMDERGSRPVLATDIQLKNLKEQFDALKENVESLQGAIVQHNESMYDLYRKQNPGKPFPRHHQLRLNLTPDSKTSLTDRGN